MHRRSFRLLPILLLGVTLSGRTEAADGEGEYRLSGGW